MKSIITSLVLLAIFWLMLSGHYTGLILGFGAVSCIFTIWIAHRMDIFDHEGQPIQNLSPRLLTYYVWLAKEIVISSLTVAKMIVIDGARVKPEVVDLPVDGMNDLEKVIYANSITLTPGTLTIDVDDDWLRVHTVRSDLLESLQQGVMADKVRNISRKRD